MDRNDMVQTKRQVPMPPVNQQHAELVKFIQDSWSTILNTPGSKGPIFYINVQNSQNSAVGKAKVNNFHNNKFSQ